MKDEVLKEVEERMGKAIKALERELGRVRTGRASAGLLDVVRVDAYGTQLSLKEVASISVPEAKLIVIQPWDLTLIENIEKAILKSELGLTPMNDGKVIRLAIPPLTEERRKELVKLIKRMAEDSRVAIRNIRRDANETLKGFEKDKLLSEDDFHRAQDDVQKKTDDYVKKVDERTQEKEKEILEV